MPGATRNPSQSLVARVFGIGLTALLLGTAASAHEPDSPHRIHPGAVELGFVGALDSVEGNTQTTAAVLAGTFRPLFSGLFGLEVDVGYTQVSSLDRLDLEAALTWQNRVADAALYPFAGVGGGVRQEWLGSFRTPRYPLGLNLGLRGLFSPSAGYRVEYRWRRVLGDPVADFTEHRLFVGVSILLRNREVADPPEPGGK